MKPVLTAVLAIFLGSACTSVAQTMVEYSSLAGKGAGALKPLSNKINASNEKIAAATSTTDSSSQGTAAKSVQTKTPAAQAEPIAKPTPPAVFILANGERIESEHYVLKTDNVQLQDKGVDRTIAIKELNVKATMDANNERGLHLMFPTSTSQMTLSF